MGPTHSRQKVRQQSLQVSAIGQSPSKLQMGPQSHLHKTAVAATRLAAASMRAPMQNTPFFGILFLKNGSTVFTVLQTNCFYTVSFVDLLQLVTTIGGLSSGVHRCMWEMFLISSHYITSVCKTNLTVVVDTNCMYKYVSYTNLLHSTYEHVLCACVLCTCSCVSVV